MKTAIVCDWLVTIGGAEKFLGHLLQCYPNADIFAVIDFIDPDKRGFLLNKPVKTTFIQKLPFAKTRYRSYLPLMPIAIEQVDVSSYDLIISSSHAVAKGIMTGPEQVHISYVHSPMRYAWDLQHQYLHETGLDKKLSGMIARYCLHKLRLWDLRSATGVDYFVANSNFIARRIEKTYRRQAEVIYPPVEITQFFPSGKKENFYLTASRLVPYKRLDLIVDSFASMPDKKLIVIGDGPDFEKIKSKAGPNVDVLGYQPNEVLLSYMQRAKAFLFAAQEDFGLLPLEAQACGTPVIAYGKGGALETVRGLNHARPTGIFFSTQTIEAICQTVMMFEANQPHFTVENCVQNAARFTPEQFHKAFKTFVTTKINS
ncbi:MAG: glycosyltransferase family 4 protein [Gammaproteobacteria bacterium]|nr:glycosyltransferase family 4 protein [Gammaproteobacteria bacterium]MCW5583006.1 glycosyltransferase family 4 protein [Gammaproteobacteria bacterium]